jgi:hypothetical protein
MEMDDLSFIIQSECEHFKLYLISFFIYLQFVFEHMKGMNNFRGQAHVKIKAKKHLYKTTGHAVDHVMLGLSVRHDNKYKGRKKSSGNTSIVLK